MSRKRTFGEVTVTFRTEQDAKDFDDYLESTITLKVGGEEIDRFQVKDRFDPYKFFGIDREED